MFRALCRFPTDLLSSEGDEGKNHPCDEWLTLETSAQVTLSTELINTKFCVSLPHRRSTTVSLETNPLVCQVTVGCAIFSTFSRF